MNYFNEYSFNELRQNLEHLQRTQSDNKGASTTLVKNNIASFMEAVDIMKGKLIEQQQQTKSKFRLEIRRLSTDDRKKNSYEPVIKLVGGICSF